MNGTVVMGIIDDGIAVAQEQFRKGPVDSRVEYWWVQDGFHYTKAQIDALLSNARVAVSWTRMNSTGKPD